MGVILKHRTSLIISIGIVKLFYVKYLSSDDKDNHRLYRFNPGKNDVIKERGVTSSFVLQLDRANTLFQSFLKAMSHSCANGFEYVIGSVDS